MVKIIFKRMAVVAFAMIAGYNVYQSNSKTEGMSELMLANVEALAGDELGSNNCYATICYKKCRAYIYESTDPCLCSLCTGN